ncbi:unnamed protein product [Cuscuta epithymum]|uniref:Retrotransposon Copia-like N-terminal domain-containing protein n=1 Tax=Cuscuta epithymum TaxID=186058 RepID=A0AAV0DTR0_9ASTE|nr:unnamed protein product [Cuscuta epithymum]CAH9143608.1 unnamed protein product [Cuscuta epithymum]
MAITATTPVVQLTATTNFPIKLTSSNYPVWKCQVHAALVGLRLEGYVDGTITAPAQFLDDEKSQINPCYTIWYRQDKVILSALLGSCSDTIQPILSSALTARGAWNTLALTYSSTSRGHIISLKNTLAKTTKGNKSISDYLAEMTAISDALALAQNPISEEDLVIHIIRGLGPAYGDIKSAIRLRETPLPLAELRPILLEHEQQIIEVAATTDSLLPTANVTHATERGPRSAHTDRRQDGPGRSRGNSFRRGRGGPTHQFNRSAHAGQPICRFCDNVGHIVQQCRKLQRFLRDNHIPHPASSSNPMANYVTASSPSPNQSWMFDSGASHHVVNDATRLPTYAEYGGPDEVHLGDGSGHGGATTTRGEQQ